MTMWSKLLTLLSLVEKLSLKCSCSNTSKECNSLLPYMVLSQYLPSTKAYAFYGFKFTSVEANAVNYCVNRLENKLLVRLFR